MAVKTKYIPGDDKEETEIKYGRQETPLEAERLQGTFPLTFTADWFRNVTLD